MDPEERVPFLGELFGVVFESRGLEDAEESGELETTYPA
jgi:hypothetical protein